MDNITEFMMKKLLSVGFSYPDYEHHLNSNMLFSYQGRIYCIGGWWGEEYTETDKKMVQEGQWLPSGNQLLEWLTQNDFNVKIDFELQEQYFHILAIDSVNGQQYTGGGLLLSYALHKVIYKICKSNLRSYIPRSRLVLEVLDEE